MTDIKKIKGAIFDADGTLLDSMWMWARVEIEYLISLGIDPRPDLRDVLLSLGGHEVAAYFRTEYGVRKTAEEMNAGMYKLMGEFYKNKVVPKTGVMEVLNRLRGAGVNMCVATATDRYLIEPGLRRCGLLRYFGKVFTCSEENTSKSSPDIFIRAAAFLGTRVSETLVIEDALYAVRSAKGAGFPVAAVYDLSSDNQRNEIEGLCDYYFTTFDEMLDLF